MAAFSVNLADLQFILDQIRIAERHAAGEDLASLIPDPHVPWGLRTVDGTYNNIVPGREQWGSADSVMPRLLQPSYLNDQDGDEQHMGPPGSPGVPPPVTNTDYGVLNGTPAGTNGGHTGNVADADPRIISNLVADMSLNNPAAVLAALTFIGSEDIEGDLARILAANVTPAQAQANLAAAQAALETAQTALDAAVEAYQSAPTAENLANLQDTAEELSAAVDEVALAEVAVANPVGAQEAVARELGLTVERGSIVIPNVAADEGLSAPFNAWMTFFGQFFDHGLDLITKGGNGTVFVPLQPDDPLVTHGPNGIAGDGDEVPPSLQFMALTRATSVDGSQINVTTPFVDQNQTYTSHPSHQVFLREYALVDGVPVATGRLLGGANGDGLATWADIKEQAREVLGIELSDLNVLNVPMVETDPYGEFVRDASGFPKIVTSINPTTGEMTFASGTPSSPLVLATTPHVLTDHAFLDDIANAANPAGKVADADGATGLSDGVPALNGSFEADPLTSGSPGVITDPNGNYTFTPPQGWSVTGFGGVYAPVPDIISPVGHSGGNVVFLDNGATLSRDIGVTLQAGQAYRLTFNVGDRTDQAFGGGTVRILTDDGELIHQAALPTPLTNGTWRAVTVNVPAIANPDFVGDQLRVEFVHGGSGQVLIDNVNLRVTNSYDNELLDAHYVTGDGRGNENIGLTAVHHIFHSEHNRQVETQKLTILMSGDRDFINEWLTNDLLDADALPTTLAEAQELAALIDAQDGGRLWDGERLFQAARFATEMQYQHLVFEEFARKVQPAIDPFVFNSVTDVDPAIFSEFANTVYRFGHSMLTEFVPLVTDEGVRTDLGLVEAFLNPLAFADLGTAEEAAGDIVRGMTTVRGNEIDEFVTGALRNNLLGLPLDLAAINLARGRDTGMPSLNDAREQLYAASGSTFLEPYDNWVDFAANLKNPASVINFIAAYGTHDMIEAETTSVGKRAAAQAIVTGAEVEIMIGTTLRTFTPPADRLEYLNSTGWTDSNGETETGLNLVDLWIGGLAEKKMPFGGMLGSTFNAVFELQLENLQDGDRLYYLTRTQGQNMLNALEQNSFAKMIMANTNIADPGPDGIRGTADDVILRHIGVDAFADYDYVLEVNEANQDDFNGDEAGNDPIGNDPTLEALGRGKVQRTDPTGAVTENFLRFTGGEHIVAGGTSGNDTIITDFGDDGIWGDAGDDRIESGAGVDLVNGGAGNDIITDSGDSGDFLKGDEGDDVIANSNGLDILMGGTGSDAIFVGVDDTEVFAGEGDDFVLGGEAVDLLMGNEGDDWIEGGGGFDTIAGDNSDLFFDSAIQGHDVMFAGNEEQDFDAESGDDIMVQGESVMRNEGMFGFDWVTYQGMAFGADADMRIPIFTTEQDDILRNRFDKVEALSGWDHNDVLRGDDRVFGEFNPEDTVATTEGVFFQDELTQEGLDRIDGLRAVLGDLVAPRTATNGAETAFTGGNIVLGGGGSDVLQGNGGDDFLDGDRWLNVRIRISSATDLDGEIATVTSLRHTFTEAEVGGNPATAGWAGRSLFELMIEREIVPAQLHIVREILDTGPAGIDVAIFRGSRSEYTLSTVGGVTTVVHNIEADPEDGELSDGTDTLVNIERLQFADTFVDLVPVDNAAPVGAPRIAVAGDADPQFGVTLSIVRNANGSLADVTDADNTATAGQILPPFEVEWQISDEGVFVDTGFRGLTYTPQFEGEFDDENPAQVRAIVRYTDATGLPQTVVSAPTEPLLPPFNITGTPADDILVGNNLDNTINGLAGDDTVFGLGGNDTINGGAGSDILDGGDGTDVAVFDGGSNAFAFEINAEGELEVVRTNGTEEDIVRNFELFRFSNGVEFDMADVLEIVGFLPTDGPDVLNGTADDDEINGRAGDDIINGNDGDDELTGGIGNDTLNGGAGIDTAIFTGPIENYTITAAGNGTVTVVDNVLTDGNDGTDTLVATGGVQSIENILFADVNYELLVDSAGNNILTGNANNNILFGLGGDDTLNGNGGDDYIDGAGGVDQINGGAGNDTIFGGGEIDTINGGAGDDVIDGGAGADDIAGGAGNDTIAGGGGVDTINGGNGDDTINGGAGADVITQNAANGGRDRVDGGAAADTYNLNGNNQAEAFRIYALTGGQNAGLAVALATTFAADSEIVITRTVAGVESVVAELKDIQEIVITGGGGGDTFTPVGNFAPTTLSTSTITIDGSAADDTIDLRSLSSAHRVVFRSNGGNDTILGTLRSQDVIEIPAGADPDDYDLVQNADGSQSYVSGNHRITFNGEGAPQLQSGSRDDDCDDDDDDSSGSGSDDEEEQDDDSSGEGSGNDDDEDDDEEDDDSSGSGSDDEEEQDDDSSGEGSGSDDDEEEDEEEDEDDEGSTPTPNPGSGNSALPFVVYIGTEVANAAAGGASADVLSGLDGDDSLFGLAGDDSIDGGSGNDKLVAGDGNDVVFGGDGNDKVLAGSGNDVIYGDDGDDDILAEAGNDRITGGSGRDLIDGGDGNDTILATFQDGSDVISGGAGSDTLDYRAIDAALTVRFSASGTGTAESSEGRDTFTDVEKVIGGSGNDVFHASAAHEVMDGGGGSDTFVFATASAADGDVIEGFQPGDQIDLTPLLGQLTDAEVLGGGANFTLAGQVRLVVTADGDTRVEINTDADNQSESSFIVAGRTNLTGNDFT